MTTKKTNPAKNKKRRQRLRLIEGFLLNGYGAQEITDKLPSKFTVTDGTVRNDIVDIRKAWGADVDALDELEGRIKYLASTRELRRKALEGGKLDLVHTLDKEIAKLSGVDLKINERALNINLQAAIMHMEGVLGAVFTVISDQTTQNQIIEAIEIAAE